MEFLTAALKAIGVAVSIYREVKKLIEWQDTVRKEKTNKALKDAKGAKDVEKAFDNWNRSH